MTRLITHIVARSSLLMSSHVVSSSRFLTTWLLNFQRTLSVFSAYLCFFSHRFTHGIPRPSGRYYIDTIAMPLNRLIWILKNSNLGIIKVSIAFVLSPFGWYAYNIPWLVILVNTFISFRNKLKMFRNKNFSINTLKNGKNKFLNFFKIVFFLNLFRNYWKVVKNRRIFTKWLNTINRIYKINI